MRSAIWTTAPTPQTQLASGGLSTGRLGFRGVEDLGNGLKAGFWLESQVNADDGTQPQTRFWHRRSTVSLISANLGEIRLGRDFAPTYTAMSDFDPFGDTGIGATTRTNSTIIVAANTRTRVDNQVSYFLPATLGGVYGQLSVAAGEGAASPNKYMGGRLGFRTGGLDVTAAYGQTEITSSDDLKVTVLSAAYDFGAAKLQGTYQLGKYDGDDETHYTVGGSMPIGAFVLRAAYTVTDSDVANRDAKQFAIGGIYNLSKRTALYGTYSMIDNDDAATYRVADGLNAIAGDKHQGIEIGVRHAF
ncbi:MAG: porin [Comamonadaceae bacterium]|nr:porin [Comamonadaceae bacterium]